MIEPSARARGLVSFFLLLLIYAGSTSLNAAEKTLAGELRTLDAMRKGLDTPTDQVEARGKALLEKHDNPDQRALIHYHLAHIHAQSGQRRPDLVMEHCEDALKLPSLDAAKRLQLYIYLGDAKQQMNRVRSTKEKLSFPETRAEATNAYLQGLKESTKYSIPETKPELPIREPFERPQGDPNDPEFKRRVAQSQKEAEEYVRQREQAKQDQQAWENRRILYDQIVYLYLAQPAADEEMREVVARALPQAMVKVLLDRFQEKVGMRQPAVDTPTTPSEATPLPPDAARRWLLWLNLGILIIVVAALLWRRLRHKKGQRKNAGG